MAEKLKGRKIYCCECPNFLGIIKNGSMLKPEMVFVCEECREKWKALKQYSALQKARGINPQPKFGDIWDGFGDVFKPK